MIAEARYFARMMAGVHEFIRTPPAPDPCALLEERLRNRESGFLDLMRGVVFRNPANPYFSLFRWAGCEYGDLEKLVRSDGLDAALERLRAAGIWLAHSEFKGAKPIERPGLTIEGGAKRFVNPLVRGVIENTSSGSRSRGTLTRTSIEYQIYREAQDAVVMEPFLTPRRAIGALLPILPSAVWLQRLLSCARRGTPIERFFSFGGSWRESGHYRLLTRLLIIESRLLGLGVTSPVYLPHNDFSPVVGWIARRRNEGVPVLLMCTVSFGVRVAAAALASGSSIEGTLFLCGAEPLTDARRAVMEQAGGQVYPRYGISEVGWVGCSCPEMKDGNCVHVMRDSVAVVSYRRRAPLSQLEVDSLLITTLLPSAAYVLVNFEVEDCGRLEPARCECRLRRMGFHQQLSQIYSFGKLTGQGITLLAGDLLGILERSLPARFGGTPVDYQLVELDESSGAVVELRVHPQVGVRSSEEVRQFFLAEVKRLWGGSLTYRQWSQTEAVRVVFAEPYLSGGRKVNPLHLLGTSRRQPPKA